MMLRCNRTRTGRVNSGPFQELYDERAGRHVVDVDSAGSEFLGRGARELLHKAFGTRG